jgi:hypothetical protein
MRAIPTTADLGVTAAPRRRDRRRLAAAMRAWWLAAGCSLPAVGVWAAPAGAAGTWSAQTSGTTRVLSGVSFAG